MIRCFIQGAQGVGKTTLVGAVTQKLPNNCSVKMVGGVARALADEGITFDVHTKPEDYYGYYYKHLQNFSNVKADYVLFDRSVLDVITYARMLLGKGNFVEKLGFELFKIMQPHIDVIAYIPIEIPLVVDGERNMNAEDQSGFDRALMEIMRETGVRFDKVRGTVKQRSDRLLSLLLRQ
ncbi:MAG: AAA family ATPase [Patescibacteria group bacterium]